MRLIDADELKGEHWRSKTADHNEHGKGWNDCLDYIQENAPTIDAVPQEDYISMMKTVMELQRGIERTIGSNEYAPVKHGMWGRFEGKAETEDGVKIVLGVTYCSECGHVPSDGKTEYCPNCGAKMDGEREEDETN